MGEDALRFRAIYLLAILCASCNAKSVDANRTLTVAEVLQNLDALNGKQVSVAGFLPECGGYDCSLFANEQQAKDFWKIANSRDRKEKLPEFVEIGFVPGFDEKAGRLAGNYVVVSGRVTNQCHPGECLDRGPNLIPTDVALSSQQPTDGAQK
jgi:hypothetical protein